MAKTIQLDIPESAMERASRSVLSDIIYEFWLNNLTADQAVDAILRWQKAVAETDANAPGDTSLVSGVSSAPNHQPHAGSSGWRDGTTIPPVERGREKEYVVAVFRQNSGKVYTFAASYLNAYPLVYQYECPNGDGCDGNGCDDGCPTTGWFRLTGDDGEAETYVSLNISEGDRLMGWCELQQWEETPPANLPTPPSPAKTGGAE